MKDYKAIFIDWDDTIGDFAGAAFRSLHDLFDQHNLAACYSSFERFYELYEQHNLDLWKRYGLDEVTKEYLEFDRMFYPLMMADRPLQTEQTIQLAVKMGEEHLQHTTDYFSLLPDAERVVRYLSAKYPLVVLSNGFVSVQYRKIDKSGLRDCFADIVLSEEVGCQKPNKRIFEIALERNGLSKEDVLMIGDSWTSDIQGAINAGIDQLWIQREDVRQSEQHATYKVNNLRDVLSML